MTIFESKLVEIAQRNPTAENFFAYAAERERDIKLGVSRLPQLREQMRAAGYEPVPQDLLTTFRELERAGVGKLQGDRFRWDMPIKKLGEAVFGPKKEKQPAPKAEPRAIETHERTLVICFGKGREAAIRYTDLTIEDVDFLREKLLLEMK